MDVIEQHRIDLLIAALRDAVGPDRAITLQALADRLCLQRREVEELIEHHLPDLPFVIVAGTSGLYQPAAAADINAYLTNLHNRHRRMQLREETVRRKARAAGWPEENGRFVNPTKLEQAELFA